MHAARQQGCLVVAVWVSLAPGWVLVNKWAGWEQAQDDLVLLALRGGSEFGNFPDGVCLWGFGAEARLDWPVRWLVRRLIAV